VSGEGAELEKYGAAVVDALLRPGECGPPTDEATHAARRRALLEAAARADKAALSRFGASFLEAYPRAPSHAPQPAPQAPANIEPAPVDAGSPPQLTLKEYAALRADCMGVPEATLGDVRARHGLDAAGEDREVAAWSRAFATDRSLFGRYRALFQELRENRMASATTSAPVLPPRLPGERRLSLHQYASLRGDCMSVPFDTLSEVRARYGLDAESEAAEVEAWGSAFRKDAALFEQYKGLFRYFRSMSGRSM